jgi:YD repeat-containing protein
MPIARGSAFQNTKTWRSGWKGIAGDPVDSYGYDPNYGNLTSITDPRGYITTITYNDPNNLTYTYPYQITNPRNHLTLLTYEPKFGKLKTSTDPDTNVTTYDYDVFGRLTKIKKPYDETSTYGTASYSYENFGTVGQQRTATLATEQSGLERDLL